MSYSKVSHGNRCHRRSHIQKYTIDRWIFFEAWPSWCSHQDVQWCWSDSTWWMNGSGSVKGTSRVAIEKTVGWTCTITYVNTHAPFYDMSFDFAHKTQKLFSLYTTNDTSYHSVLYPPIVVSHRHDLYGHPLNILPSSFWYLPMWLVDPSYTRPSADFKIKVPTCKALREKHGKALL